MAPDAIAACVPNDAQPLSNAPAIAPQIAPTLLLHGTSRSKKYPNISKMKVIFINLVGVYLPNMPKVKTPNVVPAAIADNEVATCK